MTGLYFNLSDDIHIPGRWHLDEPLDSQGQALGTWRFVRGEPAHIDGKIRIPLYVPGMPLDVSLVAGAPLPVVHARVASVFSELAPSDVQLIPVRIDGQHEQYFLLNVTNVIRCIDDEASEEVHYWKPEDGMPDKTGRYSSVIGLRIDPSKAGDAAVFRTWGWSPAIIISERLKRALEHLGPTGAKFEEVTTPSTASTEERVRDRKIRDLFEQADTARETAWRTLGVLDQEVFMPIAMSESWPGHRQLWRVIRREAGRTLLVTHGLSDPPLSRSMVGVASRCPDRKKRRAVMTWQPVKTKPVHGAPVPGLSCGRLVSAPSEPPRFRRASLP